jgi:hypothetical protein
MTENEAVDVCRQNGLTVCRMWRSNISGALYVWAAGNGKARIQIYRAEQKSRELFSVPEPETALAEQRRVRDTTWNNKHTVKVLSATLPWTFWARAVS